MKASVTILFSIFLGFLLTGCANTFSDRLGGAAEAPTVVINLQGKEPIPITLHDGDILHLEIIKNAPEREGEVMHVEVINNTAKASGPVLSPTTGVEGR